MPNIECREDIEMEGIEYGGVCSSSVSKLYPFTLVTIKIKYPGTNSIPINLFVRSPRRIWQLSSVTFDIFWVCERPYCHKPVLVIVFSPNNCQHLLNSYRHKKCFKISTIDLVIFDIGFDRMLNLQMITKTHLHGKTNGHNGTCLAVSSNKTTRRNKEQAAIVLQCKSNAKRNSCLVFYSVKSSHLRTWPSVYKDYHGEFKKTLVSRCITLLLTSINSSPSLQFIQVIYWTDILYYKEKLYDP